MAKLSKTNAMRILDNSKIDYEVHTYPSDTALSAIEVAKTLGKSEDCIFKTLVTEGKSKEIYVFVIPGNKELDLKKAAHVVKEKSISMMKSKDLLKNTGYIHGGCSPIGMKKQYKSILSDYAKMQDKIIVSAGQIGLQLELSVDDICKAVDFEIADVTV